MRMQEMMKMQAQMMADMKADEVKLDALLKEVSAASGEAKVNALVTAVTELARQHKELHEHMGRMHSDMMGGRGMGTGR